MEATTALLHTLAVATGAWCRAVGLRHVRDHLQYRCLSHLRGRAEVVVSVSALRRLLREGCKLGALLFPCTSLSMHFSLVVVSVIDAIGSFICEYLSEYISL